MIECLIVLAYVGPGAGLSMLGALFAVIAVLILAAVAPLLYPIRWGLRKLFYSKRVDHLE